MQLGDREATFDLVEYIAIDSVSRKKVINLFANSRNIVIFAASTWQECHFVKLIKNFHL